ncbi:disease resistance protein Roq1-like [Prosopis cineraria]|uniref:disease resistance protein Roq1-like n=1 Tax=Prosopis cineraria TaxID=364024 RepID=UPI00240ED5DE|nr:disease resistance protein Roq1-like [Prosopis cineraria]
MVGIWGMSNVGKTTLAKAIYNEMDRTFERRCFLSDISREVWEQGNGVLVRLQNQLLLEICKITNMKINSIEEGTITLKYRLCHERAFVVLDGVREHEHLNALCGSHEWYGQGSIIIITSVNMILLSRVHYTYGVRFMCKDESIELFSWHAFKQANPAKEFIGLSSGIVALGGVPLMLEVLGSYLFGKEVTEWKVALEKLKRNPDKDLRDILKISFDGLNEEMER